MISSYKASLGFLIAPCFSSRLQKEIRLAQKVDYPAHHLPGPPSYDKISVRLMSVALLPRHVADVTLNEFTKSSASFLTGLHWVSESTAGLLLLCGASSWPYPPDLTLEGAARLLSAGVPVLHAVLSKSGTTPRAATQTETQQGQFLHGGQILSLEEWILPILFAQTKTIPTAVLWHPRTAVPTQCARGGHSPTLPLPSSLVIRSWPRAPRCTTTSIRSSRCSPWKSEWVLPCSFTLALGTLNPIVHPGQTSV